MTERTSNKQLLDAIEAMPAAIAAAIATVASGATPVATPTTEGGTTNIGLDKKYEAHMALKVQDFANDKGESAVLYARRNGRGEVKLAYCLHSKWSNLKDRGLIGAVSTFKPEA